MSNSPIRLTSRTYDEIKEDMLAAIPTYAPSWTNHGEDDYGITLLEMVAGVGDGLNFYIDRQVLETFLRTASLRKNVVRIAQMLQYRPKRWYASTGNVIFTVEEPLDEVVFLPPLSQIKTQGNLTLTTTETLSLPIGFVGEVSVAAIQGSLESTSLTSSGEDPLSLPLPEVQIAEQMFEVFTASSPWYDSFDHPLDSNLTQFYYIEEDDRGVYHLVFRSTRGDIPAQGTVVTVKYLKTDARNIEAGTGVEGFPASWSGKLSAATDKFLGARIPETIAQIKDRAPANIYTRDRAVTRQDYHHHGKRVPGVKSVHAVRDRYGLRAVDVYVAGETEDTPSNTLLNQVRDYLLARNDITVDVRTHARILKDIKLTVLVKVLPSHLPSMVLNTVSTVLTNALSYENMDFGRAVWISDLYHLIEAVDGVDYSNITALHWTDQPDPVVGNLIPTGPEHGRLAQVDVRLDG